MRRAIGITTGLLLAAASAQAADKTPRKSSEAAESPRGKAPTVMPQALAPGLQSLRINGGASTTLSAVLNLAFETTGGTPTQYQASLNPNIANQPLLPYQDNPGYANEPWLPYKAGTAVRFTLPIDLQRRDNEVRVYARVRNQAGTSNIVSSTIAYQAPPTIASFRIADGAATIKSHMVYFDVAIQGTATQFRVSERADFAGAPWQPVSALDARGRGRYAFRNDSNGTKTLLIQIRRGEGAPIAATDTAELKAQEIEHRFRNTFSLNAVGQGERHVVNLVPAARDAGYDFRIIRSGQGGVGCWAADDMARTPTDASVFSQRDEWKFGIMSAQGAFPHTAGNVGPPVDIEHQVEDTRTRCDFSFFVGADLAPGWRLRSVKLRNMAVPVDDQYDVLNVGALNWLAANSKTMAAFPGSVCQVQPAMTPLAKSSKFTVRVEFPQAPTLAAQYVNATFCILDEVVLVSDYESPNWREAFQH